MTVEVYTLALFLDTCLMAYCLNADFTRLSSSLLAGVLFVLAVTIHITNVLLGPIILVLVARKAGPSRSLRRLTLLGATVALGAVTIAFMMLHGRGRSIWPPDFMAVLPRPDPSPPSTIVGSLSRSLYGFARTVAYLPDFVQASRGYLAVYAFSACVVVLLVLVIAARGFIQQLPHDRPLIAGLALMVIPFVVLGFGYYPSDPERWLFLMPPFWLVLGLIWDRYQPHPAAWLRRPTSQCLLAGVVVGLGVYNAAFGLFPDTQSSRYLTGLRELTKRTVPHDLVISPAGIKGTILEFYLGSAPDFENLRLTELVARYPSDPAAMSTELRSANRTSTESRPEGIRLQSDRRRACEVQRVSLGFLSRSLQPRYLLESAQAIRSGGRDSTESLFLWNLSTQG